jgi:regulator of cell morphogenesis and NO signaling
MKEDHENKNIGDIVADDFRTAEVFKKAGIDFCCGGKKSLSEACQEKEIDENKIIEELEKIKETPINPSQNYKEWDAEFLSDYIINTHHKYVVKTLPDLIFYTNKIANVHGNRHSELYEVADLISNLNAELLYHLKEEEEMMFPAIKEHNYKALAGTMITLTGEHEAVGSVMDQINKITKNYKVPEDGCETYKLTMKLLKQFEDDLHTHVHLENNVLFPKVFEIIKRL